MREGTWNVVCKMDWALRGERFGKRKKNKRRPRECFVHTRRRECMAKMAGLYRNENGEREAHELEKFRAEGKVRRAEKVPSEPQEQDAL